MCQAGPGEPAKHYDPDRHTPIIIFLWEAPPSNTRCKAQCRRLPPCQRHLVRLSRTASATSSITSSKSKVPQVNPVIRPACDPEKQGTRAKPSGDLVSRDQISNRSPDPSRVLSRDKSRDSTRFGWARSLLINKWQTVGMVHNQQRHVTLVIG